MPAAMAGEYQRVNLCTGDGYLGSQFNPDCESDWARPPSHAEYVVSDHPDPLSDFHFGVATQAHKAFDDCLCVQTSPLPC